MQNIEFPLVDDKEEDYEEAKLQQRTPIDEDFLSGLSDYQQRMKLNTCDCCKILIVDDNSFNIFSLKTLLEMKFKFRCDEVIR